MKNFRFFVLLLTGTLLACQSANNQLSDEPLPKEGVSIHLVTSPVNLGADATALDKISVTIDKTPLISYDELESYSSATYTFRLKPSAGNKLNALSKEVPLAGKPFAVVVDGNVVYYGLFWNPISSFSAAYPYAVLDTQNSTNTTPISLKVDFRTTPPGGMSRPDQRNNARLTDRLKQDNKLI